MFLLTNNLSNVSKPYSPELSISRSLPISTLNCVTQKNPPLDSQIQNTIRNHCLLQGFVFPISIEPTNHPTITEKQFFRTNSHLYKTQSFSHYPSEFINTPTPISYCLCALQYGSPNNVSN